MSNEDINIFGMAKRKVDISPEVKAVIDAETKYVEYISTHVNNVCKVYDFFKNCTEFMDIDEYAEAMEALDSHIRKHDDSKYSDQEFPAYRVRWYPVTDDEKELASKDEDWEDYKEAWEHHLKVNPHHPEHWKDEDGNPIDMPLEYIIEMICDWQSFGLIGKGSAVEYWEHSKEKKSQIMTAKTIEYTENILDILKRNWD